MPDNLRRYTVSAVVDTDTGLLVGTAVVRPGHEDYDAFHTVEPLAANQQFRWVHVWAPNIDAAADTEALTADLRPGGDRSRPVARAFAGDAGLKPYSVAAVVHTRSGQRIGEPVVAEGHHALGGMFMGRRGTRAQLANVWARDAAAAIEQAFGAKLNGTTDVALQRMWNRLAGMPADARAALIADTVWNREYPPAYHEAYITAATQIATAATEAAAANPGAWLALYPLAVAAGEAVSRLTPDQVPVPPADQRTVAAAHAAAEKPGPHRRWRRIADLATVGGRTAATLAGSLTATGDVLTGWRARGGRAMAEHATVYGTPAHTWVAELLASVNRDTAARVADPTATPANAAELASQGTATNAATGTAGDYSTAHAARAAWATTSPTAKSRSR